MHATSAQKKKKKNLITMNIFTINEACCFILDESDREIWCGNKIIPLINRRLLRQDVNQTNKLRKILFS